METVNEEVVEVVLGVDRTDTETVDQALVETNPRSFTTLLSALGLVGLLVGLGVILVPLLTGADSAIPEPTSEPAAVSDPDDSSVDEPAPDGEAPSPSEPAAEPQRRRLPGPTAVVAGSGLSSLEVFPLLPESRGLSLVIKSEVGLSVLNADDGSRRMLGFEPFNQSSEIASVVFGSSIVVHDGADAVGYPLAGGPVVEYGRAQDFWVSPDGSELHLTRHISNSTADRFGPPLEVLRFGLDSRVIGEPVEVPRSGFTIVFPIGFGQFSLWGGDVYEFVGDGFERIYDANVIAVGVNHLIIQDCDDQLRCASRLFDHRTREPGREVELGDLNLLQISGELSVSPTGDHVTMQGLSPSGEETISIVDTRTGDRWDLPVVVPASYDFLGGVIWSPDGRYVLSVGTERIHVLDVQAKDIVGYDIDALELGKIRSATTVVDLNE